MSQRSLYEQSLAYFLAPVAPLLDNRDVTEVLINGRKDIYFEQSNRLFKATGMEFPDDVWLASLARNVAEFVGRKFDDEHQSLSGRLHDGSRVHVIGPGLARNGLCISIRRFNDRQFSLDQLAAGDSLSDEAADALRLCVRMKANMVVSGGTGTGKTTLLNALSAEIAADERIIVIEDTSELLLQQEHAVRLEARPADGHGRGEATIRSLFVDSLRMRPDRITVGEVRHGEALDMVQSMLSGHAGAMTTVHANTPRDALTRLETLCLMSKERLPHLAARIQVGSAIHIIVQIERHGPLRRVAAISECAGLNRNGRYRLRPLFRTHYEEGGDEEMQLPRLKATGASPLFAKHSWGRLSVADRRLFQQVFPGRTLPRATRNDRQSRT